MDNNKCPVCGKVGIPDYLNSNVVCPQCGSDLSIYRVIDQIPTEPKKRLEANFRSCYNSSCGA